MDRQRRTWTFDEKEAHAIVMALRKWANYIPLHPVTVCTDHYSLQLWQKEHVDTPSGPASGRTRWHETLAEFDLTVVYISGKDNIVADCISTWAYSTSKGMTHVSAHGDEAETAEAKKITDMERMMEEDGVKSFFVMAADALLGRRVTRADQVLLTQGAGPDKHLLPELCLCNRCIVVDPSCDCEACSLDAPGVVTPDTAPDISEPN